MEEYSFLTDFNVDWGHANVHMASFKEAMKLWNLPIKKKTNIAAILAIPIFVATEIFSITDWAAVSGVLYFLITSQYMLNS